MSSAPPEIETFKKIIERYAPSGPAIGRFKETEFAVIAGPAVSGKDTLRNGLLNEYPDKYHRVMSLTTRKARPDEDLAYEYVSFDEMKARADDKKLLQVALVHNQQVSAIDNAEVDSLISSEKTGLSILIVQEERKLYGLNPRIRTVFLIPPSFDDMMQRLNDERALQTAEIRRRLQAAKKEIEIALATKRYYCLVSDVRSDVRFRADEFFRTGEKNLDFDKDAREICGRILKELNSKKL